MAWRCSNCGISSQDSFAFCPHCGTKKPEPMACPKCGYETGLYKFCPNCGTELKSKREVEKEKAEREYYEKLERAKRERRERIDRLLSYLQNTDLDLNKKMDLEWKIRQDYITEISEIDEVVETVRRNKRTLEEKSHLFNYLHSAGLDERTENIIFAEIRDNKIQSMKRLKERVSQMRELQKKRIPLVNYIYTLDSNHYVKNMLRNGVLNYVLTSKKDIRLRRDELEEEFYEEWGHYSGEYED